MGGQRGTGGKGDRGGERTRSPAVNRRERAAYSADSNEGFDAGSLGDLSKEVSHYLSSLNTSTQNKMSLIKMQIIKCDENSNIYGKLRQCLNHGDMDEADHCLATLEESNYQAQLDLKNEVADGPKVSSTIGMLVAQLRKERVDAAASGPRGRSPGGYNARNRSTSANRSAPGGGSDITGRLEAQIGELRRNLATVENENSKLKSTMREMVDDYTRQLELRDDNIKRLEQFDGRAMRQDIEDLNHENRTLKEKTGKLSRDLDMCTTECDRLKRDLMAKERQIDQ